MLFKMLPQIVSGSAPKNSDAAAADGPALPEGVVSDVTNNEILTEAAR
jgi:hypothetical protein